VVPLVREQGHGGVKDGEYAEDVTRCSSRWVANVENVLAWRAVYGRASVRLIRVRMWATAAQLNKESWVLTSLSYDESMGHPPHVNGSVTWAVTRASTEQVPAYVLPVREGCTGVRGVGGGCTGYPTGEETETTGALAPTVRRLWLED
jgi:hypothetical protein